jgi:hypothetical protein
VTFDDRGARDHERAFGRSSDLQVKESFASVSQLGQRSFGFSALGARSRLLGHGALAED